MEKLSSEVITDFKVVVADVKALLKATANPGGEQLAEARSRTEASLEAVKDRIEEARVALLGETNATARTSTEKPWEIIATACAIVLASWLISRRQTFSHHIGQK